MKNLSLTYAARRKRYGESTPCEPSRFLAELPKADLNWEGQDVEAATPQQPINKQAHLASMRSMLNNP